MLEWFDILETGNPEIDLLHCKLVEDCNELLALLADDVAWSLIVAQTRKLVTGCIDHFRVEEAILDSIRFPRCELHAQQHRRMEEQLLGLLAQVEQVDGTLKEHHDLPASLGPALIDLMIRHDLDYRSHILHQQGR